MKATFLALARGDAGRSSRRSRRCRSRRRSASGRTSSATTTSSRSTSCPTTSARRSSPTFGPEEDMQLFGRGLRRRLPPMLDGDARPDPPRVQPDVLAAGDAGAVLRRGDRDGREPRDPGTDVGAHPDAVDAAIGRPGFSTAPPSKLRRPITEGRFGPLAVNVEDQRRDPDSMLNWMERMIRRRRETPELGRGTFAVLDAGRPNVLAHRVDGDGRTLVFVHNLAPEPCEVTLPLGSAPRSAGGRPRRHRPAARPRRSRPRRQGPAQAHRRAPTVRPGSPSPTAASNARRSRRRRRSCRPFVLENRARGAT